MLEEKDFDEIGKRLYDLEADPPTAGWDKIAAGMASGSTRNGTATFMKRNWWKPLVLLVPIAIYISYENELLGSWSQHPQSATISAVAKDAWQEADENPGTGSSSASNENKTESTSPASGTNGNASANTASVNPEHSSSDNVDPAKKHLRNSTALAPRADPHATDATLRVAEIVANTGSSTEKAGDQNRSIDVREDLQSPVETNGTTHAVTAAPEKAGAGSHINPEPLDGRNNLSISQSEAIAESVGPEPPMVGDKDRSFEPTLQIGEVATAIAGTGTADSVDQELVPERLASAKGEDSVIVRVSNEHNKNAHLWRITTAVNANYNIQTIRPSTNDEVLVTQLKNNNDSYRQRISYSLTAGVGREVRPDLFIDASVSLSRYSEDVIYAYATGTDTLITTPQSDGSVRVSPVYNESEAQVMNEYTYGGLRLGGTFYFWRHRRSSFNITASAGLNFLVNSNLKERFEGEWREVRNPFQKKSNYNLMIGAGYSIRVKENWEVMLNPTLTHNFNREDSGRKPFSINQRAVGLTLMLSRYIGR